MNNLPETRFVIEAVTRGQVCPSCRRLSHNWHTSEVSYKQVCESGIAEAVTKLGELLGIDIAHTCSFSIRLQNTTPRCQGADK